jgi:dTDP-4-dehydrorhamnose reductase
MLMARKSTRQALELWGGIECSYNRVRSKYFDQLHYCDHYTRAVEDIASFAALGITTMRYPIIWERLKPKIDQSIDWSSVEISLNEFRKHGIKPIAGLVHHGSGPRYADITSSDFATGLASFAAEVAAKFPWIDYYTPVNEPLTTARFCGLYGVWYPHKRNDRSFVIALLNEMKGVVLAMQAIRKINPSAKLVQTEDLAKVYSTPFMRYQADFENHRRWLTFDILCGRLKPGHALWNYFKKYSNSVSDLQFFIDNPCPPNIIGLDYYPTSERFLDENLYKYPVEKHGHNHRHQYADAEAIRVRHSFPCGPKVLLKEVWERYKIPMVVTEVHIHCDYDNQIRWFSEIRDVCMKLIEEGADILAVTTWAMLGSFGWNRLLTKPGGDYESGAFDISTGRCELTPLGKFLTQLSRDPEHSNPALESKGWWHEEDRFLFEHFTPADLTARDHPVLTKEDCVEK